MWFLYSFVDVVVSVSTTATFKNVHFWGVVFQNFSKIQIRILYFTLPFSERQFQTFLFSDFSVRSKKIILRNPKMDIFKMSKNVQNRNLMGSLKYGGFLMDGTPIHMCSITKFQEIYKSVSINVGKNVYNYLRKICLNGTDGGNCSIQTYFLKNFNIPTLFFLTIFQSGNSKHFHFWIFQCV